MPLEQAREYLARVIPWPQEGDPSAWVNLHWTFVPKDLEPGRKLPWTGRAVRTVAEAAKAIDYALKSPDTRDIYVCQSAQREAQETQGQRRDGKGSFTYHKPVRLAENATALKSIWLDIDAYKDGPTGYPTMDQAVAAFAKFLTDTGMPKPTMAVMSGGGIHAYWIMSRALTPAEWYELAYALVEATKRHGLRCDSGCTTDAARVLRVPDTYNCKQDPKRPVRIGGKPLDFDYSVERIEKTLAPYKVPHALPGHLNNPMLAVLQPRPPIRDEDELSAGIETAMPRDEVRACLDAIPNNSEDWNRWNTIGMRVYAATEGAAYGLEEWQTWSDKIQTKGADSCEERWATYHGSPPSRTGAGALVVEARTATGDAKWTPRGAILAATNPGGLQAGVPGALPANSPLGVIPAVGGGLAQPPAPLAGPPTPSAPPTPSNDLPPTYSRDAAGIVSLIGLDESGATTRTPISDYPLTDPWLQRDPWILNFTTVTERGKRQQIALPTELIGTNDMRRTLQAQGFMLRIKALLATEFFVSWVKKLQESKDTVTSSPFGWSTDRGRIEGFVYGGKMFTPAGERVSANPDPITARQYGPSGDLQPWIDACDMVTAQDRQDLAAIVASAYAAPLVRFTGQAGLLMSTWSQESGIGKSTALLVAQAVWGDPIRAVQALDDTANSVVNKIGEIRSLPLYWDELKTEEATKKFVDLAFRLSGGKEKSRMTSNIKQRDPGTWQTILVAASNDSLLSYIINRTSTTTAGLFRVFEYEVKPAPANGPGQIDPSIAQRTIARMRDNFGQAGLVYAEFLGKNFDRVDKEMGELLTSLGNEVNTNADERFWLSLIACVLLGARYANELNLTLFDEPALKKFMLGILTKMRRERSTQTVDMKNANNVSDKLAQFINANRSKHTLYTNRIHITPGKPAPGAIKVLRDVSKLDNIHVHIGLDDKLMRISSAALSDWLKEKEYSRHIFVKALEDEFNMKRVSGRIASGTVYAGPTEYLLQIDLAGSALTNFIDEV